MNQSQETNDVTKFNILKYTFDGINTITRYYTSQDIMIPYAKQILIDKWGDLIILTNSGTASTLLKYTTAGTLIDTKNLAGARYGLDTDRDGNYYIQHALGTEKITANTAQGQAFTSAGVQILPRGNAVFGGSITGYNPAVFN